jgi:hypothetical protein
MQQMTALQDLQLFDFAVPPTFLASLQQLQRLALLECTLLPSPAHDQLQHAGAAALLDLVASLKHLQHLQLDVDGLFTAYLPLQRFSALTASSWVAPT